MRANPSKAELQAAISTHLARVHALREALRGDVALQAQVAALKRYQAARLRTTYADLHAQARYAQAVDFFITDLYGDRDFSRRDADLERIVPALGKLLPLQALVTLESALHLHALSEALDVDMARAAPPHAEWTDDAYAQAWRTVGNRAAREEQLRRVVAVGEALDHLVRVPLVGVILRSMAGPAAVAGLSDLHGFLSDGYRAFAAMRGAQDFLRAIAVREADLMTRLFDAS